MRQILTSILFLWCAVGLWAQQAPQYSLYMLNPYGANPAYAGLENTLVATGIYRQQWSGLEGAPVTQHVNAHLPLYVISSGIGIKIENDAIGAHRTTQALLTYSYQLPLSRKATLSVGASAGYLQYVMDGAKLRTVDGQYEPNAPFFHNDLALSEGKIQAGTPVFEAGLYLQAGKLEVGAAIQPVFAPRIRSNSTNVFALQPVQHYIFSTSYQLQAAENMTLRPSIFVKTDFLETQSEISLVARWQENIFAGASFRGFTQKSKDAAVILAGLRLNEKTTLAYSFDIPLSALQSVNRGSHELLLRYSLNRPIGAGKLPPIIYNPRFF